jgi:hypothetical protein
LDPVGLGLPHHASGLGGGKHTTLPPSPHSSICKRRAGCSLSCSPSTLINQARPAPASRWDSKGLVVPPFNLQKGLGLGAQARRRPPLRAVSTHRDGPIGEFGSSLISQHRPASVPSPTLAGPQPPGDEEGHPVKEKRAREGSSSPQGPRLSRCRSTSTSTKSCFACRYGGASRVKWLADARVRSRPPQPPPCPQTFAPAGAAGAAGLIGSVSCRVPHA